MKYLNCYELIEKDDTKNERAIKHLYVIDNRVQIVQQQP